MFVWFVSLCLVFNVQGSFEALVSEILALDPS